MDFLSIANTGFTNSIAKMSNNTSSFASTQSTYTQPSISELEKTLEGFEYRDPDDDIGLGFEDFLSLMVQQLQNQTMDNTADTTEMLNQLVQMSTVQTMSALEEGISSLLVSSNQSYAASLVGKDVTVANFDSEGSIIEIFGTVTGSGTYDGQPVIFVDDVMYYMDSIMAVGRLPEMEETPETDEGTSEEDTEIDPEEESVTI